MELGARLRKLEESAAAAPERCPECDARIVRAYRNAGLEPPDTTRPVVLLPMRLEAETSAWGPCPRYGAVPLKLRPMRLDGDVQLEEQP